MVMEEEKKNKRGFKDLDVFFIWYEVDGLSKWFLT
jgi:hypothetical protein